MEKYFSMPLEPVSDTEDLSARFFGPILSQERRQRKMGCRLLVDGYALFSFLYSSPQNCLQALPAAS